MISYRNSSSLTSFILCYILVFALCTISTVSAQDNDGEEEITPTLGLEEGYLNFETPGFQLKLVKSSQTIAALEPKGADNFDFTPSDRLEQRNGDNFYHLGDLNLRLRIEGDQEWKSYSTAGERQPVSFFEAGSALSASDLSSTLSDDIPLQIDRYWEIDQGNLVLRLSWKTIPTSLLKSAHLVYRWFLTIITLKSR